MIFSPQDYTEWEAEKGQLGIFSVDGMWNQWLKSMAAKGVSSTAVVSFWAGARLPATVRISWISVTEQAVVT